MMQHVKKIFVWFIKIIISVFLMGVLLRRFGLQQIADVISRGYAPMIGLAIITLILSHIIGSVQWWVLLRNDGVHMPWKQTLSFYFVGLFFNNFLISQLGGDMFRMVDVKRYSQNGASAVSTVFVDRMLGLLVMSGLAMLSTPWLFFYGSVNKKFFIPIGVLFICWLFLLFLLFNKRVARLVAIPFIKAAPENFVMNIRNVYINIHKLGDRGTWLLFPLTLAFIVQSLRIFTHYFLGRAVGIEISPLYFFMFIPIVAIMASLPVSFGGLGMREQSGIILFGLAGVVAVQATVMELLAYIISVLTTLPGGFIFIFRKKIVPVISSAKENVGGAT